MIPECKTLDEMLGKIADYLTPPPKDKVELDIGIGSRPVIKDPTGETKGTYNVTYKVYYGGKVPEKEPNLTLTLQESLDKGKTDYQFKDERYEAIIELLKERNLISEIEGGVLIIKHKPVKHKPGEQLELFPDWKYPQPEFPKKKEFFSKVK